MMAFFFCSAGFGLALGFGSGVFPVQAPTIAALLLPSVATGAIVGARCFAVAGQRAYRRVALAILAVIALVSLGHSLVATTQS
jgi:uncharacterized membrane protein YfcA